MLPAPRPRIVHQRLTSKSLSPAEMGQGWRHDVAAATKHAGAVAQPDGGNPGTCQLFMIVNLRTSDFRGLRGQVGPCFRAYAISSWTGVSSAIRVTGTSGPPSGRRRIVGSRLSRPASRAAVTATDSSARCTAARRSFQSAWARLASAVLRSPATAKSLTITARSWLCRSVNRWASSVVLLASSSRCSKRHVQQYLVGRGQSREARPDHALMRRQRLEPGLGQGPNDIDHGYIDRAGNDGARHRRRSREIGR